MRGRNALRYTGQLKQFANRPGRTKPVDRLVDLGPGASLTLASGVAAILAHAYEGVLTQLGCEPTQLALTHPVGWDDDQVELLRVASQEAGIGSAVRLLSEPAAAGMLPIAGIADDRPLVVFDIGASTFDIAVLSRKRDGRRRAIFQRGLVTGGDDIDAAILELVAARLMPADLAKFEALRATDAYGLAEEAKRVKETLSAEEETTFAVEAFELIIDQDDLNKVMSPIIEPCISAMREGLSRLKRQPAAAGSAMVLLSGGSAQIPLVSDLVRQGAEEAGAELVTPEVHAQPGQLVALGAVFGLRPYTLRPREAGILPQSTDLVVIPASRVAFSADPRVIQLMGIDGTAAGSAEAGGPTHLKRLLATASDGGLISASGSGVISWWRLRRLPLPAKPKNAEPLIQETCWWRQWDADPRGREGESLTALAVRDGLIARDNRAGSGLIWNNGATVPLQTDGSTAGMAFVDDPQGLLIWNTSGISLRSITSGQSVAFHPFDVAVTAVAVDPATGMVYLAADELVRCLRVGEREFSAEWESAVAGVRALCWARAGSDSVVIAAADRDPAYLAVDALTGRVLARAAAASAAGVQQIVPAPVSGNFVARRDRQLIELTLDGPDG